MDGGSRRGEPLEALLCHSHVAQVQGESCSDLSLGQQTCRPRMVKELFVKIHSVSAKNVIGSLLSSVSLTRI